GRDAEHIDAPVREPGEHIHDVVLIDQGVGQLYQRLHHFGFPAHPRLTSLPSAAARSSGSGLRTAILVAESGRLRYHGYLGARGSWQPELAGDNVSRYVRKQAIGAERVRLEADERIG